MTHKKKSRATNRAIIRFFRNLTKHREVIGFKTEFGYIFVSDFDDADVMLWIDRTSNTLSMTTTEARSIVVNKPKLH